MHVPKCEFNWFRIYQMLPDLVMVRTLSPLDSTKQLVTTITVDPSTQSKPNQPVITNTNTDHNAWESQTLDLRELSSSVQGRTLCNPWDSVPSTPVKQSVSSRVKWVSTSGSTIYSSERTAETVSQGQTRPNYCFMHFKRIPFDVFDFVACLAVKTWQRSPFQNSQWFNLRVKRTSCSTWKFSDQSQKLCHWNRRARVTLV